MDIYRCTYAVIFEFSRYVHRCKLLTAVIYICIQETMLSMRFVAWIYMFLFHTLICIFHAGYMHRCTKWLLLEQIFRVCTCVLSFARTTHIWDTRGTHMSVPTAYTDIFICTHGPFITANIKFSEPWQLLFTTCESGHGWLRSAYYDAGIFFIHAYHHTITTDNPCMQNRSYHASIMGYKCMSTHYTCIVFYVMIYIYIYISYEST